MSYLLSQFRHRPVRALGVIGGVALGAALTALAPDATAQSLGTAVGATTLALALLIALSGVVAAGWLQVRLVARLKPSEALRSS